MARSDTSPAALGSDEDENNPPPAPAPTDGSPAAASGSQKRGRGRPPKSKSDSHPNGAVSARKPSGRPKRNATAAAAAVPAASAAAVKSGRGRPRRSNTQPATESPVTGSRKRGRPKRDDVAAAAPAKKRGRKPKTEQVAKQRTSNGTRKATEATTGQGAADPREFKKKTALLQKKVKQAADKLKIAVSAIEEVQKIADGM